jgi:hypothetical protein
MSRQRDSRLRAGTMDGSIRLIGRALCGRSMRMGTDAAPIGATRSVGPNGLRYPRRRSAAQEASGARGVGRFGVVQDSLNEKKDNTANTPKF